MDLERKKKQLELARVQLARQEMELKIFEREAEIARLKEHIKVQEEAERKLKLELE